MPFRLVRQTLLKVTDKNKQGDMGRKRQISNLPLKSLATTRVKKITLKSVLSLTEEESHQEPSLSHTSFFSLFEISLRLINTRADCEATVCVELLCLVVVSTDRRLLV